ncbi:uncharacterized protein K489DRAFT_146201 [Dissoconium aciculare CBS 342.82]|uniref:Uncharacterized protein n=1 Tax=Dissoconium aciculare CBS 342.82 TaxID=1314786 RepID=A0A6J3MAV2_9PEZI|nr:uncharacterized protein K489DRAFT_146201 [Dissoconium aciculare CBS 342.82]KAF1824988.1 hypothetical protein K489DRAFT_146201 [Dissoconium aciculare CBS 342.82]
MCGKAHCVAFLSTVFVYYHSCSKPNAKKKRYLTKALLFIMTGTSWYRRCALPYTNVDNKAPFHPIPYALI